MATNINTSNAKTKSVERNKEDESQFLDILEQFAKAKMAISYRKEPLINLSESQCLFFIYVNILCPLPKTFWQNKTKSMLFFSCSVTVISAPSPNPHDLFLSYNLYKLHTFQ